jgi:hypothetical protein
MVFQFQIIYDEGVSPLRNCEIERVGRTNLGGAGDVARHAHVHAAMAGEKSVFHDCDVRLEI